MKAFTTLFLIALAAAAPAAIEKRIAASITLFDGTNYSGASYTQSFNVEEQTCVSATLPSNIDGKASSVRLDGDLSHFNCRLYASQNCEVGGNEDNTWFFNFNIPDFSTSGYAYIDNRVRSLSCGQV